MSEPLPAAPTVLFMSHASEDKEPFVRPLVKALEAAGFKVWLDEVSLTVGDSIWRGISDGLRESDFGVVVLSPSFMEESKKWPGNELDGMFAIEEKRKKFILPIWWNVDFEAVKTYSTMLAGRKAALGSAGIENVVRELQIAVQATAAAMAFAKPETAASRLKRLAEKERGDARAKRMIHAPEGRAALLNSLGELLASVRTEMEEVKSEVPEFKISLAKPDGEQIFFTARCGLWCGMCFTSTFTNTLQGAHLRIHICQATDLFDSSKFRSITLETFTPGFLPDGTPLWESERGGEIFSSEQLRLRFMNAVVDALENTRPVC